MNEPMEDYTPDSKSEDENKHNNAILRPNSLVMMTISPEDYQTQYWPKLQGAIDQLLTMSPGDYILISYEQMYSCVYKCVCKQFSEQLYRDLIDHITNYLESVSTKIQDSAGNVYINNMHSALHQYLAALLAIVPIFNYMNLFYVELKLKTNLDEELKKRFVRHVADKHVPKIICMLVHNRFYVELKLKTSLDEELKTLFVRHVADKHVPKIIPLLVDATSRPFYVQPTVMASLVKNLYSIKPEYSSLHPMLFAKYIPNVLPPCSIVDVERCQVEVRQMQRDLLTHPDFIRGDQGRKRPGDDEFQQPTNFFSKST